MLASSNLSSFFFVLSLLFWHQDMTTNLFNRWHWQHKSTIKELIIWLKACIVTHIHFPVCLWIMDSHSRAPKKNTSHGNRCYRKILHISYEDHVTHEEVHANYQQGNLCQDPAGNQTTQRPPDLCREMQTAVVWSCLQFIRSGQIHLTRHSGRGKKTRQTEEDVGKQRQGLDRPGVRQVPEGRGKWGKLVEKSSVVPQRSLWLRDRWGDLRWDCNPPNYSLIDCLEIIAQWSLWCPTSDWCHVNHCASNYSFGDLDFRFKAVQYQKDKTADTR